VSIGVDRAVRGLVDADESWLGAAATLASAVKIFETYTGSAGA